MKKRMLLTPLSLILTLTACQTEVAPPVSQQLQAPQTAAPQTPELAPTAPTESAVPNPPDQPITGSPSGGGQSITLPSRQPSSANAQVVQASNYNTETVIAGLRAGASQTEAEQIAQRHGLALTRYLAPLNSAIYATQGQSVPTLLTALQNEPLLEFVEADQVATQDALAETEVTGRFGLLSESDETETDTSNDETENNPEDNDSPADTEDETTLEPATPRPNDTYFHMQYSFDMMNVIPAWAHTQGPELHSNYRSSDLPEGAIKPFTHEALVGIIDAGMAMKHVDLAQTQRLGLPRTEWLIPSYDAYSKQTGQQAGEVSSLNYFKSSYKQGTHSAGIIAAQAQNGKGIAGIAPHARVIPIKTAPDLLEKVKALFSPKDADSQQTMVSVLADAITWAVERDTAVTAFKSGGVDVLLINTPVAEPSALLKRAIAYAVSKEVLVVVPVGDKPRRAEAADAGYCLNLDAEAEVVSCGDDAASAHRVYNYLATLDDVIGVGAVDKTGNLATFSATGPFVSVVAPGVDIIGPVPGLISNSNYSLRSGTGVAAAQVAGVLAQVLSADKMSQIGSRFRQYGATYRQILTETAQDKGAAGYDFEYGHGLVDAGAATGRAVGLPNDEMLK